VLFALAYLLLRRVVRLLAGASYDAAATSSSCSCAYRGQKLRSCA